MMAYRLAAGGALLLLGTTYLAFNRTSEPKKARPPTPAETPATASVPELTTLYERTTVAQPQAEPAVTADPVRYAAPDAEEIERMSPEELRAYEKELRVNLRRELDQRFDRDGVDRAWQSTSEERLGAALTSIDVGGVALERVDCKQSICRATLTHASPEIDQQFMAEFTGKMLSGFEHQYFYAQGRTTIFSIRRDEPR